MATEPAEESEDFPEVDDVDEEGDDEYSLTAADVEDVLLFTLDWSVQSLLERIGTTFDISPSFQRRDAWRAPRKSRYIESLMLGLPVPQIVLAEDKAVKGKFIVLDGKQRLVTMKQFANPDENFPALKLRDMEFLPQLNNKTCSNILETPEHVEYVNNLLAQPVRTIVVRNWRKPAVLYKIFLRLNQGSLPLSPQELRQALYPGPFSNWVNERSASSDPIHHARRLKAEDFRMRDAEMLLRGVAFLERFEAYEGNLREFLDETCRIGNTAWAERAQEWEKLADQVEVAINRTEQIFGQQDWFLRWADGRYIRRFNIAVFDAMIMVLSSSELDELDLSLVAGEIKDQYQQLCSTSAEFQEALKSTTKTVRATARRVMLFGELVEAAIGKSLGVISRAEALLATLEH